ncbi:uncharacterized protein LOC108248532 [Kryptolebias marmoratus]|nr:uncharacterized protein LOC108248532 [Kryptolebias marmoratus]
MAGSLLLLSYAYVIFIFVLLHGGCSVVEPNLCDPGCSGFPSADLSYQKGVRYTYRYSTVITTTLKGSNGGRNGLALDCVVDIDVVSKCHLTMQIRNSQIKRLSPQREHSVLHLKSLRESLERTRLKFSLQGGKVTALCLQEGEQVWALNIKRALLSMLQTSRMVTRFKEKTETDVHGTCKSRYERRGPLLLKTRDLNQCHQSRLDNFWPHSVPLTEDTLLQMELHCVQCQGEAMMEEVNCTEVVSMSRISGVVKTKTESVLLLLKTHSGTPSGAESLSAGVPTDLQFEDEGTARLGKTRPLTPQRVGQSVRLLYSLTSDPQLVSQEFLQLVFQLKDMNLSQLKTFWQEASFKYRNDWQPLLDALTACGSENCIILLTDLIRNKELEEGEVYSFLTPLALIPHPSPQIIGSINALLDVPELQSNALLVGSSLVYQLCKTIQTSCDEIPQVQSFIQTLEKTLKVHCEEEEPSRVRELLYSLKSVGNSGFPVFIPLVTPCMLSHTTALELRLAAIQAFRRFPCSADRSVLLQLYSSSQEDTEVRIAAYQQLMLCPDQEVFEVVKTTLRSETSSQVGSFVWSHLTNVLRSEDPMKQTLVESLPDDIISREFEAEFWKYSSYSDHTFASDIGMQNVETSLIFSPKSFLPRSASANLTVYIHGRAHNLLEVDLHIENAEPLLKSVFGHQTESDSPAENMKQEARQSRSKADDGHRGEKEACLSSTNRYLNQARAMLFGRKTTMHEKRPKCWVGVKVFGNELSLFTCDDIYDRINQVSLSMAGLAVKLLKGHEVQLSRRAVLMNEELLLPSLSGVPIKLGINMTSLLSLNLKGNINYRDTSHFSLNGHIRPSVFVGLSARMGVDSVLGQAAVEWVAELRSSTSLDGSFQLQEGRDIRVTLNTPQDLLDVISFSSRLFQLSGNHKEEIKGPKSRVHNTSCTPKTWSKMIGWQLCANVSYPPLSSGITVPPPGPVHLSLRLLKLDRGLHYYLLEVAYSLHHQRGSWLPREASIHLLLATPQSSIPRDMSLDLAFNSHRVLLRITHPLKTILIQGQFEQEKNIKSGKLELVIDSVHYYVMGLVDTHTLLPELRTRYHFEAKMAADDHPMIVTANITRGLGRKTSFSAAVKNVFRETASLSVALERRRDGSSSSSSSSQYSVEAELLLPGLVGSRMLGLMEQRGSLWSSVLRLKYGLGGDARNLRQECYMSQRVRSGRDSNLTYIIRADHEFYCTNTAPINHKFHFKHEESSSHIKSALDMSYGKHWDEINNKHTLFLSQSFKNQSTLNHTNYILEFNLQVPAKNLNYRTQLMHSHLMQPGSESSTHLKINYNDLMPLVAGFHWKSSSKDSHPKKWEGTFNMDTPWLYIYTTHKLSWLQRHTLHLTSELTASKSLSVRNLVLQGFYRDRNKEKEARLEIYTPAVSYLQAGVRGVVGNRGVKASGSLGSLWTLPLRGNISLEVSKSSHSLLMSTTYGKQDVSFTAVLNTADKRLKKRLVIVKMSLSKPKSMPTEVEIKGVVEEVKRDKNMYQKVALLHLRQPLQNLPQSLLLRETFTVNLLRGIYVLESKAKLHDNREAIHTLTLCYKSPNPFVCSELIHPFSSDLIPADSEICVTLTNNQTHQGVQGRLLLWGKEKLNFWGQIQQNSFHSNRQALKVKANFINQLQLRLPSSALVEGDVSWNLKNNTGFDYQARGKLRLERQECQLSAQLNGTSGRVALCSSLRHPFKSKIPKTLEVKATADTSVDGKGSSTVYLRADGKDRVRLDAQMSHSIKTGDRALGLRVNVSQSLLPAVSDLHLNMAANMSSDSMFLSGSFNQGQETLLTQVQGSFRNFQLSLSGNLRHSMSSFIILPPVLDLDGLLGQSDNLIEGHMRVQVMETVHSIELRHQGEAAGSLDKEEGTSGEKSHGAQDWLCVWSGLEHFCVNVSLQFTNQINGDIFLLLSHSTHLLSTAGVPSNSSAQVKWMQDDVQLSVLAELQAGTEHLKAEFHRGRTDLRWEYVSRLQHQVKALQKRGLSSSFQAKAHYQLETEGLATGLVLHMENRKIADIIFNAGSKNKTAVLVVSVWQQMKPLQGLIPNSFEMNCTGNATVDQLSAYCFGNVTNRPVETLLPAQASVNISITRSGCFTDLSTVLLTDGMQKGSFCLSYTCHPHHSLKASVLHSVTALKMLHIPTNGALLLNVSTTHLPAVDFGLELGRCYFRGNLGNTTVSQEEVGQSYSVNVTSYCPVVQGTILPRSLAFQGLLLVTPCQVTVSSSLRADNQDLSVELSQSCRTPHLSGTLNHSFPGLQSLGMPQIVSMEATSPAGPDEAGALFIKVGTCTIRAKKGIEAREAPQGLWAVESTCPVLKPHLNGSVWQHPRGIWRATLDSDVKGRSVFLRFDLKPWPELSVEAVFRHELPSLKALPKSSRLRFTSSSGSEQHHAEVLIVAEDCAVRASGAVMSQPGLQASLVYHNNCSTSQEWGSPNRLQAFGSLVVSSSSVDSHISMVIDDSELQTALAARQTQDQKKASFHLKHSVPLLENLGLPQNASLNISSGSYDNGSYFLLYNSSVKNQKLSQEVIVGKTADTVRVRSHFKHTVKYLNKLGVSANNNIQVELASAEGKALSVQSRCGDQHAGLKLHIKNFPLFKEITGTMWHSWTWLQDQGLPFNIEGLCSIKGALFKLQSRAQLSLDGQNLLTSGLNFSGPDGHLAALLSFSPAALNQTKTRHKLHTVLSAQFKGTQRSTSLDIHHQDWRVRVAGEIGAWGTHGGAKEARITLKHNIQGQTSPALQVEAWGRLTGSHMRCSMAINPELSSSLAVIVQGHYVSHRKDLMVNVVHNVPKMLFYLPSQLSVRSQLNRTESSVAGLVEVLAGRRRLWALGELAAIESGYRQEVEVKHSYPQLKPLPRTITVRTLYEAKRWSYNLQQSAVWGKQKFNLSALYSAPPGLETGNQTLKIHISGIPCSTHLDVVQERSLHGRLDQVLLGWTWHGRLEQIRALSSWSHSEERNETKLVLEHPFSSTLSQLSLHTASHSSQREQNSRHQTHLSWDGAVPVNISLSLDKLLQTDSRGGKACVLLSAQQMGVSSVKGCVSMGPGGDLYSQMAEIRWDSKGFRQNTTYQIFPCGLQSLQVYVALDGVSPSPCHSHELLAKVQTNLKNHLEHKVELGVCPQQPPLSWSGSHRVSSGEKLFYTQSQLSVTGRPHQCSFTLALTNSSTAQGTNVSLSSEWRVGNLSMEVGGNALSWPRGSGLQVQATLDHREKIWLNGTLEGPCLQTTTGFMNGPDLCEDLTLALCAAANHSLRMDVLRREACSKVETLGSLSLGTANQRLTLRARGYLDSLTAAEIQNKLTERMKTFQQLLIEIRSQSKDSALLQELSAVPLRASQQAEALLGETDGGLLSLWLRSPLRHTLTSSLPHFLNVSQQASLLGQQELRRPLATLAGVYQDVKGQKLESMWREAVLVWTDLLVDILPVQLDNPHLSQTGVKALRAALDMAVQHISHWVEGRLASVLSGIRKWLASVYRFSPRESEVTVSVPLPPLAMSRVAEVGLLEVLLEEWLLRPLQGLASVRPNAELYHFKRKIMDSPFRHQALLVADQFIVTFDGRLYELQGSCPLLLAQDTRSDPSFMLLLHTDPQSFLLIHMNNITVNIQPSGQVKAGCSSAVTHYRDNGLTVKTGPNVVQVSNKDGQSVSCDLLFEVCSFTLDGWLHGASSGLFGTNDNDAGNEFPLHDGSQAKTVEEFVHSWQLPKCSKPTAKAEDVSKAAMSPVSCDSLFSSPDSSLSSCFRVVDPGQFLSVCELSSNRAPCRLAWAFVHLCQQNYIPLEVPVQCMKV